jgi:hypothetical protein
VQHLGAVVTRCENQRDRFGEQPSGDEAEHLCRHLIEPL